LRLLKTIAGIGCFSAMEMLVELQYITRLWTAYELAARVLLPLSTNPDGLYHPCRQ
jgi:hypothetical protein